MMLYYLVNSVETKNHKYFRNGSDIGGESYDGTNRLLDARFFTSEDEAKSYIKTANSWWTKYDFHVCTITSDELMALMAEQKLKSFILDDKC